MAQTRCKLCREMSGTCEYAENPNEACLRCCRLGLQCLVEQDKGSSRTEVALPAPKAHELAGTGSFDQYLKFPACWSCQQSGRRCDRQRPCDSCCMQGAICDPHPVSPERKQQGEEKFVFARGLVPVMELYYLAHGYGPYGVTSVRPRNRLEIPGYAGQWGHDGPDKAAPVSRLDQLPPPASWAGPPPPDANPTLRATLHPEHAYNVHCGPGPDPRQDLSGHGPRWGLLSPGVGGSSEGDSGSAQAVTGQNWGDLSMEEFQAMLDDELRGASQHRRG